MGRYHIFCFLSVLAILVSAWLLMPTEISGSRLDDAGIVYQRYSQDCAISATTMLLQQKGMSASYEKVAAKLAIGPKGADMAEIVKGIKELGGGDAQAVALKPDSVAHAASLVPMIAHLKYSHYVIIEAILPQSKLIIADPASGRLEVSMRNFLRHSSGKYILIK